MKIKINTKLIFTIVLIGSISLILAIVSADSSNPELKSGRILIANPANNNSFFIASANISQNETISPVLRTDFPFNSLYLKWQDDKNQNNFNDFVIYVRFLHETWSDWDKIALDDDANGKDGSEPKISSQMIATKLTDTFQYKIAFDPHTNKKEKIKNLEFIYLDTIKGPSASYKISSTNNDLNIISRAEWGANENYKYDQDGNDLWEETYYQPKKFIIHHTAGEDSNVNSMAAVRAIQYWHAVGKGWGDIGYNYLIDSQGNIYEGRKGGDGVVGGHAYMNNQNSIGIAILGCYDSEENCNTPDNLTEATKISLNKLIAYKSREFNIDPLGESYFNGKILPNVIGHNDVGSTLCPGEKIKAELTTSRQLAYNILQDLGGYQKPLPAQAEFVRQSTNEITIEETKTAELIAEFKNTGQAVWRGYADAGVFVAESNIKKQLAAIDSVSIALNKNYLADEIVKYTLLGGNVYPGETGRFKINLSPPADQKSVTRNFTLAWQNKGYFPGTDFSITINKVPCASCQAEAQQTTQAVSNASLSQSTFPSQMLAGETKRVNMQFLNTGNQSLSADNLKLKIVYTDNLISPFRNNSWYSEYAMIPPQEAVIYPNQIANFNFNLQAPNVAYQFPHTLTLLNNDQTLYTLEQIINVESAYAATITENTLPVAIKNTWRPTVRLTFKNSGSVTWQNPILKSTDIDGTNSWFRDNSWDDNKTIARTWQKVEPGEFIIFEFRIDPYWKPNTYPHVYNLYDDENEISINGKPNLTTYTRVDS